MGIKKRWDRKYFSGLSEEQTVSLLKRIIDDPPIAERVISNKRAVQVYRDRLDLCAYAYDYTTQHERGSLKEAQRQLQAAQQAMQSVITTLAMVRKHHSVLHYLMLTDGIEQMPVPGGEWKRAPDGKKIVPKRVTAEIGDAMDQVTVLDTAIPALCELRPRIKKAAMTIIAAASVRRGQRRCRRAVMTVQTRDGVIDRHGQVICWVEVRGRWVVADAWRL